MKKLIFFLAIGATIGLTSCSKNSCYDCTISSVPDCTVSICEQTVSTTGVCAGIPPVSFTGLNNEQIKDLYEQSGYTCVKQ